MNLSDHPVLCQPSSANPSSETTQAPVFTGSLGGLAPSVGKDGRLAADDGFIQQQVDNPLYREAPLHSWAAEVRMRDGSTDYHLAGLDAGPNTPSSTSKSAAEPACPAATGSPPPWRAPTGRE